MTAALAFRLFVTLAIAGYLAYAAVQIVRHVRTRPPPPQE